MSISAMVSAPLDPANVVPNAHQLSGKAFQQLTQALSVSLTDVAPAFESLRQSVTSLATHQSAQVTPDLRTLGVALQSGDLAGARNAYSSEQNAPKWTDAIRAAHYHHHRGGGGSPTVTSGFPNPDSSFGISAADTNNLFQPVSLLA